VPFHGTLNLDEAVTAKSRSWLTRCGIQSQQPGPCGEKNARRDALLTRPVRDATRRGVDRPWHLVAPDLFSAVSVERQHLVASRGQEHDAVHNNWRDLWIATNAVFLTRRSAAPRGARTTAGSRASTLRTLFRRRRWPTTPSSGGLRELHRPGLSQLRDITGIDVRERREAAAAEVTAEHRPVVAAGRRLTVLCHDGNPDEDCR
jgi:hypothetical protein